MNEWFFTFCGKHHSPQIGPLAKRYVRFTGTFFEARQKMLAKFGSQWGFQYPITELEEQVKRYGLQEVNPDEIKEIL